MVDLFRVKGRGDEGRGKKRRKKERSSWLISFSGLRRFVFIVEAACWSKGHAFCLFF